MPLIALTVSAPENPFGLARRELGILTERVLDDSVHFFAQTMLAERFSPGNAARFKHETRNKVYREQIKKREGKGQGRYVDLQLSGKMMRQAKHLYKVTGKKIKKLRLTLPAYATKPFIGSFRDPKTGRMKRVTRQPDKVAELVQVDAKDRTRLQTRANKAAAALGPKLLADAVMHKAAKKTYQGT